MYKLFFLLFCSVSAFGQSQFSPLIITPSLKKNANIVVMDEKIEVDLTKLGKMTVSTYQVTAVLNKYGDTSVNTAAYYDEGEKVRNIEVYIYDAMGKEVEHYKRKDFKDVSVADGFSLFSDNRALYLDYTPTSYPYTLVFVSETESNGNAFIPRWYPVKGYARGLVKSEIKIKHAAETKLKYKSQNLDGLTISVSDNPNEFVAVAENVTPIDYEEYALPASQIMPQIKFAINDFYLKGAPGNGTDWNQFGQWMNSSLLTGVSELPEATVNSIKALVANETSNEAKARKIYQYVQDKVRYISVQIGIGGWKPMLASDVDRVGYGDCKALTNYTKALLEVVEIPSYYTILYAGDDEIDIQSDFTSMQGNHVILGVPDGSEITWLECTSQDVPYGFIGNFTDDRDVVVITPEGGKIMHTKVYELEENLQNTEAEIKVLEDGSIKANLIITSSGLQYDDTYALETKDEEDLISHYTSRWGYLNGVVLEKILHQNNKEKVIYTEEIALTVPNFATKVGEDKLLVLNAFNQTQNIPPRIIDRKQKLNIKESFMDTDRYVITLPESLDIDVLPKDKTIENDFGKYAISFKKEGANTIIYSRELQIKKGVFPSESYKSYRSFRRSIAKLDKTKILINPKN